MLVGTTLLEPNAAHWILTFIYATLLFSCSIILSFFFLLSFFLDFPLTEWIAIAVLLCNCSPPSPLRLEWGAELSKHSACQLNRRSGRELQVLPRPSASLVEGGGGETVRRGVQTPSDLGGPGCPFSLRASVVPKTGACVESRRPAAWLSQKEGWVCMCRHESVCPLAHALLASQLYTLLHTLPDTRFHCTLAPHHLLSTASLWGAAVLYCFSPA